MAITIRAGQPDDRDIIAHYQCCMADETEGLKLDMNTVRQGADAIFADERRGRYYLACRGDRVIGCLLVQEEWSDWRNRSVLWIHSVYILPEERRSGVFSRMYAYLKEMVEADTRYAGLRLYVDKQNEAAWRTYEKLGMNGDHYATYEWMKDF